MGQKKKVISGQEGSFWVKKVHFVSKRVKNEVEKVSGAVQIFVGWTFTFLSFDLLAVVLVVRPLLKEIILLIIDHLSLHIIMVSLNTLFYLY